MPGLNDNDISQALAFGIIIQSPIVKRWQFESIKRLIDEGHLLTLVIKAEYNDKGQPASVSKFRTYLSKHGLWKLHEKLFHKPFLNQNIDISDFLASQTHYRATVKRHGKYTDRFSESDIDSIKEKRLDFILRFGLNIIRGEILNAAKYGIWSLHHDDERTIRGGPPGFWEIYQHHTINGILLQRLTDQLDQGIVLRKAMTPVISHSYKAHHNELLKSGVDLICFAAKELAKTGKLADRSTLSQQKGKMYYFPKHFQMIKFWWILFKNKIHFQINDLFRSENWNIGVSQTSVQQLFNKQELNRIDWHPNPSTNKFYADGFMHSTVDDNLEILFEDFDYTKYKGHISKCSYSPSQGFGNKELLLDHQNHLSFPYILSIEDQNYFLPENHLSMQLTAYNIEDTSQKIAMADMGAIDPVIFRSENRWWLFCTRKEYGSNQHLFAYYSDKASGPWKEHQLNPIVSDARMARMAGPIIQHNAELYRAAQINHQTYGEAIQICKITKLSIDKYEEEKSFVLSPKSFTNYNKGMHTICISGEHILIDAKNTKFVPTEFVRKLKQKLHV
jgi:hypothetical protein